MKYLQYIISFDIIISYVHGCMVDGTGFLPKKTAVRNRQRSPMHLLHYYGAGDHAPVSGESKAFFNSGMVAEWSAGKCTGHVGEPWWEVVMKIRITCSKCNDDP